MKATPSKSKFKFNPQTFQPPLTIPPFNKPITISYISLTKRTHSLKFTQAPNKLISFCSNSSSRSSNATGSDEEGHSGSTVSKTDDGVVIKIGKVGKRCRRIESSVGIDAGFDVVWGILTDYERLADFIPGLAVSRLVDKADKYARLFQIGQQNLPLGLKFNAKAIIDCYEKDLEILSFGQRRDIEFKMVEGDFDIFEGKWSIEQMQYDAEKRKDRQFTDILEDKEYGTILSYEVEVEPKPWLPVGLIEDRLCKEIKTNLCCVRDEAHLRLASLSS